MQKTHLVVVFLALVSMISAFQFWNSGEMILERIVDGPFGVPTFIAGELGHIKDLNEQSVQEYILSHLSERFHLNSNMEFVLLRQETDVTGMVHYRFEQHIAGHVVTHASLIVHIDPSKHNLVFAVTTHIVPGNVPVPKHPLISVEEARESLKSLVPSHIHQFLSDITLVKLKLKGKLYLAYKADIFYVLPDDEERAYFYLDAVENTLIAEISRYAKGKNRQIYEAAGNLKMELPGTRVCTEGSCPPTTDTAAYDAYTYTGVCYDYYYEILGRDSYNNAGATMVSTVHYRTDYNNAFWNSEQMVFGDGDGINFSDFAADLTVVCHELTHAVVEYTAGLVYRDESGALNEGFADIFGFSSYMYKFGSNTPYQWMIGAECYTPFKSGDALRYMNDPVLDGVSYDYYPGYTGMQDNGGVHWNSGIANLAYVLAVDGGKHPQGKSNIQVDAIGIADAEVIWYLTLSQYLTAESTFADARASSVTAAKGHYPASVWENVDKAWAAVGVPNSSV